uniref:Fucosyltransferase n=1 Tax=Amphimedon queenslandica TaxID=400682 RepID=A0A1X7UYS0_AMPQE
MAKSSCLKCFLSLFCLFIAIMCPLLSMREEQLDPVEEARVLLGTGNIVENLTLSEVRRKSVYLEKENSTEHPIIIWWTPFTGYPRIVHQCKTGSCLFTHSRTEYDNPLTVGFMFYGTMVEWTSLPLPRKPEHLWILLHEESSKNNWLLMYESVMSLFNITSTSSRYSSYPLITQYLDSIEKLLSPIKTPVEEKSKGERGLVMYLHSDCDPPSDRDSYVSELMKYVQVDSFGKCLHNKDLPEGHLRDPLTGMDSEDLLDIISQYKFTLAMENAICNDYITEKFWRPFYAGSVPVVKGSPTVKDWAPSEHSIILIDDFKSPKELAEYLIYLDKNNDEYVKYLEYKKTGVTNERLLNIMEDREWKANVVAYDDKNMIESYECFVCDSIHERLRKEREGLPLDPIIANKSHYDCQFPESAVEMKSLERFRQTEFWRQVAKRSGYQADAIGPAINEGKTQDEVTSLYNSAADGMTSEEWEVSHNKF